ncbi:MAG TPA: biotin--[acetyl-CoA-carboxylase] ligase [Stellaceae bacterium]|jgi:BirA family biotin operon repressor/biotin-[acetyl-CoA-carboxylase] ligase|nr:biotin--[acetyl-CoA-carboxylase] ligase [Stellaceae bacterium]
MTKRQPRLPPGYRLLCYDSIGSTNEEAKHLARDGVAEGTLVWALEQTAGRGRRGRVWVSPRGNLYFSLILRPDCPTGRAAQLGFVAVLAVGGALRAILPRVERLAYKWPNDVLTDGRKIAGVLLESETVAPEKLSFVVVGVGINLTASPQGTEFPASSIVEEGLGEVTPEVMLEEFAAHFQLWFARWRAEGFAPVRAAWSAAAAIARGEPIRVRLDSRALCGRFLDLDHEGNLLLDYAGECRRIAAGEVFPAA